MFPFGALRRDILKKVKSLVLALSRLAEKIRRTAQSALDRLFNKIPAAKRRLIFACTGGGLALLILMGVLFGVHRSEGNPQTVENTSLRRTAVPPEEIFLPDEPDFLPGVMLGRERRTAWTVEDAAPFWQDPLKNGEEQWRKRVESGIDELLERVP
jgi:hypothetical protein